MVTRLVVVFVLLLVGACDSPPTFPVLPTPPPPAGTLRTRVTGSVTDERGLPIAGTSIGLSPQAVVSTVSSADGSYDLSVTIGSPYGFGLHATREDYEPNYQWVPSAAEAVRNFRLRDMVRIATGEGLTVAVDSDDTLYGSSEQYRARRVHVVARGTGNLVVDGSSNTGHPVLLSDRSVESLPCCPTRLDLAVNAGQEVTVHILTYWLEVPAEFSVTTRLEPR